MSWFQESRDQLSSYMITGSTDVHQTVIAGSARAGCCSRSSHVRLGFEYLQEWRPHRLFEQPVSLFNHSHSKKKVLLLIVSHCCLTVFGKFLKEFKDIMFVLVKWSLTFRKMKSKMQSNLVLSLAVAKKLLWVLNCPKPSMSICRQKTLHFQKKYVC